MQYFRTELSFTLEMCWFSAEVLGDSSPGHSMCNINTLTTYYELHECNLPK